MKFCSASSASASVATTTASTESISPASSVEPYCVRPEKWEATRLRIDLAFPTYRTRPSASRKT